MVNYDIRPVQPADYPHLRDLQDSVWFPTRSVEGWRWLCQSNPDQAGEASGLVCQTPGQNELSAFCGSVRMSFMRSGEELTASMGHTIIVTDKARRAGTRLVSNIIDANTGFCAYTLNNNALSVPLYRALHGQRVHEEVSCLSAYWVTNQALYVHAGIERRAHTLSDFKWARSVGERFNAYTKPNSNLDWPSNVHWVDDPVAKNEDRETFAQRLANEPSITVRRDHTRMAWRLSDPQRSSPVLMWTFDRGDGVEAWLIAIVTKESEISPPVLTIMDLIGLKNAEKDATPALINAALLAAKQMKLARLTLPHLNPGLLESLRPVLSSGHLKKGHPHAHVMINSCDPDDVLPAWRTTPLDGDYIFAMRQPPFSVTNN